MHVDIPKRQSPRQNFNYFEQCLTCRHLQKRGRRQADDQFLSIPKGQSSDLDPTDPVKKTIGQVLSLKGPKQDYEAKSAQYLASYEPKGASFSWSFIALLKG